jgi:NTE family protein
VALSKWRRVRQGDVFSPLLQSGIRNGARYLAEVTGIGGRIESLLDTTPLWHTVNSWMDWKQLRANTDVHTGPIDAVGVAATETGAYRTSIFVEGRLAETMPAVDDKRGVDYREATLKPQHIMASAAIPVAFQPVWVHNDVDGSSNWYVDGGVRLNAPLKPAIALGVDKLVVVATAPADSSRPPAITRRRDRPDIFDAAGDMVHAGLVDRMVEDIRTLSNFNEMIAESAADSTGTSAGTGNGGGKARRQRRVIPYIFAGPVQEGEIAALASDAFSRRYGRGPMAGWGLNLWLLNRLLGDSASQGELLSHLFFDPEFVDAAIALGAADAWRLLDTARDELPWRTGPVS